MFMYHITLQMLQITDTDIRLCRKYVEFSVRDLSAIELRLSLIGLVMLLLGMNLG